MNDRFVVVRRGLQQRAGRAGVVAQRVAVGFADSAAVLGPVARRITHYAGSARCVRTNAASQSTKRAHARRHRPCAPRRAPFAPPPARPVLCRGCVVSSMVGMQTRPVERQAVSRGGRICGAEARRGRGGVRSTPREHARRACSNAAGNARVVSCAARPGAEHWRAVGEADRHNLSPPRLAAWRGRTHRRLRGSISENVKDCKAPHADCRRECGRGSSNSRRMSP